MHRSDSGRSSGPSARPRGPLSDPSTTTGRRTPVRRCSPSGVSGGNWPSLRIDDERGAIVPLAIGHPELVVIAGRPVVRRLVELPLPWRRGRAGPCCRRWRHRPDRCSAPRSASAPQPRHRSARSLSRHCAGRVIGVTLLLDQTPCRSGRPSAVRGTCQLPDCAWSEAARPAAMTAARRFLIVGGSILDQRGRPVQCYAADR